MKMSAKEKQAQNNADLLSWLGSPQGRRVFLRLLTQSGLWSSSYAESPTATAYNEGRRSVALALMTEAQRVTPELYSLALREQLNDEALTEQVEPHEPND